MPHETSTAEFSRFTTYSAKTRKVCKWCGSRALRGLTVRRKGLVRDFVCLPCLFEVNAWLKQQLELDHSKETIMDDTRPDFIKEREEKERAEAAATKDQLEKLKALVLAFRENDGLTLRGHNNPNGADWYQCPCCGAMERIQGYASDHSWDLSEVTHKDDCALMALVAEIQSWE